MEKDRQFEIGEEIIKCFTEEFNAVIAICPEEWDGFELRQFAVDWFNYNYTTHNKPGVHSFGDKRKTRRKNYENEVLIKNLL